MTSGRDRDAVSVRRDVYGGVTAVVAEWDFSVRGGTFGVAEATAFAVACADAAATATPLVTILRSGGTRLQEGMGALVGIARATLALQTLAAAGVPHVCVADHPTTGGVWVAVGAAADVRAATRGATVGFSGPRVVAAMTGVQLPPGANTAESAAAAGLVDALVDADDVGQWLAHVLGILRPDEPAPVPAVADASVPPGHGWEQVVHSRTVPRPGGRELLAAVIPDPVWLHGGDDTAAAAVGRLHGRRVLVAAIAADVAGRVTPAGYRLLARAAACADRLALPLVTLVDTAGADPLPASEDGGLVAEMAAALTAVLACRPPTVAVVHGEGGSGGALAAAVADVVAVTDTGWFAALGPEGAAAALRTDPAQAADLMHVAPRELLADGFADAVAPTEPATLAAWLAAALDRLGHADPDLRRTQRQARWSAPLSPSPEPGQMP